MRLESWGKIDLMKRIALLFATLTLALGLVTVAPTPATAGRVVSVTCTLYANGVPLATGESRGDSTQFVLTSRACAFDAAVGTGFTAPSTIVSSAVSGGIRTVKLQDHSFTPTGMVIRTVYARVPTS